MALDHHDIIVPELAEQPGQLGAVAFGTRGFLFIEPQAACRVQRSALQRKVLVVRADASVTEQHGREDLSRILSQRSWHSRQTNATASGLVQRGDRTRSRNLQVMR